VADRVIGSAGFAQHITGQLFFLRVVQSSEPGSGRQSNRFSRFCKTHHGPAVLSPCSPVLGARKWRTEKSVQPVLQNASRVSCSFSAWSSRRSQEKADKVVDGRRTSGGTTARRQTRSPEQASSAAKRLSPSPVSLSLIVASGQSHLAKGRIAAFCHLSRRRLYTR